MPPPSPSHRGGPCDHPGCARRASHMGQPALSLLFPPSAGRKQFARHEWAQKAAYLLGCSLEELSSSIFKHQPKGTLQRSTSFRQGPEEQGLGDGTGRARGGVGGPRGDAWLGTLRAQPSPPPGPKLTALECLEGMAAGLYSELFTLLISLLNRYSTGFGVGGVGGGPAAPTHPPGSFRPPVPRRALKSSQHSVCSVTVVDTPGAQNPEVAGQSRGATFEELCHNYAQERLQLLFHQRTFAQELERYKEVAGTPRGCRDPLLSPFCSSISCDTPPAPQIS